MDALCLKFLVVASIIASSWSFRFSTRFTSLEKLQNLSKTTECAEPGRYCVDPDKNGNCQKSHCLPCSLDPDETANGLNCQRCALDFRTKLPMCTGCKEGVFAHVFALDKRRWLCQESSVTLSKLPTLCSEGPVPRNARTLRELWKVQEEDGTFHDKIVRMEELEDGRGPLKDGYPEYITISLAIFPRETLDTPEYTNHTVFADLVFSFKMYRHDNWIRFGNTFKTHPELLPSDDLLTAWYLDEAFENEQGQFEAQLGFVKHAVKGQVQVVDRKVTHMYDPRMETPVPLMRLPEAAIQSLGACSDYWFKERLPRDHISKPAIQMMFRIASSIDAKADAAESIEVELEAAPEEDTYRCKDDEYCTIGPPGRPCHPPGRCLPCRLDYDGYPNGLLCTRCQLNTVHGTRFSVPTCMRDGEDTCNGDAVRLRDETDMRVRHYCRPPGYVPGNLPLLCSAATQGGVFVSSDSEFWSQQKEGSSSWPRVHARLLPLPEKGDGFLRAYFIFLPLTNKVVQESAVHWAMAASRAEQMLMFKLRPEDKLMTTPGSQDDAIFEFLGSRKDDRGRIRLNIAFKKEIRDELNGERLVTEKTSYRITKDSLLALAACVESFQKEKTPTQPEPEGYFEALAVAGMS